MTLETLTKEDFDFYAPRFEVAIEDKKLTMNISKQIIEVSVSEVINEGASFRLTLHDEFDMNTQKFKWLDNSLFTVGNKIKIEMGYGSKLHQMIIGRITSLEPSFFAGDTTPTLTIGGHDLSYDYIKRTIPERTFVGKTYSDIAQVLAKEAGLHYKVDTTEKFDPSICKNNDETYYAFLNSLKDKVGFIFDIKEDTLYFVKQEDDKKEILTLELGKDIISFRPSLKTTRLLGGVIVRGHNQDDPNKPFIGKAMAGSETYKESGGITGSELLTRKNFKNLPIKVITNVVVNSDKQAKEIAKAVLNKASDTFIVGDVECIGIPQIKTGVCVKLEKMGERFSRKYYVLKTTHTISNSGYKTSFTVKSNSVKKAVI